MDSRSELKTICFDIIKNYYLSHLPEYWEMVNLLLNLYL